MPRADIALSTLHQHEKKMQQCVRHEQRHGIIIGLGSFGEQASKVFRSVKRIRSIKCKEAGLEHDVRHGTLHKVFVKYYVLCLTLCSDPTPPTLLILLIL